MTSQLGGLSTGFLCTGDILDNFLALIFVMEKVTVNKD
jgi:hypothetical protein